MARRTKKVGITGKFGPRYGVTVRKKIKEASKARQSPQKCPECQYSAVKRESSGIWICSHCGLKFAASAYSIKTREFKKEQATMLEYEELSPDELAAVEVEEPVQEEIIETEVVEEELVPEEIGSEMEMETEEVE